MLTAGMAVAQEDERANSLEAGAWALMFGIDSDFTLEPFEGGSLSLKRHFSDRSAVRVGIDLSLSSNENTVTNTFDRTTTSDAYSFRLEGLYQRYTSPGRTINFYWGAGAFGGYSDRTSEATADSTLNRSDTSSYSLGATGALGVEFFAARSIGIHAEYRASVGYNWNETVLRNERPGFPVDERSTDGSGWNLGSGSVRFGLSAYF